MNTTRSIICEAQDADAVRVELGRGADPYMRMGAPGGSRAAFIAAILTGNTEVVRVFLEHGCDVNARGPDNTGGATPLEAAVGGLCSWNAGSPDCIRLLLENGADPNARDSDGGTPLHLSVGRRVRKCRLPHPIAQSLPR